jgi:hypothetical protein
MKRAKPNCVSGDLTEMLTGASGEPSREDAA